MFFKLSLLKRMGDRDPDFYPEEGGDFVEMLRSVSGAQELRCECHQVLHHQFGSIEDVKLILVMTGEEVRSSSVLGCGSQRVRSAIDDKLG